MDQWADGKGVLIRTYDGMPSGQRQPATFINSWHMAPNVLYVTAPECPNAWSDSDMSLCENEDTHGWDQSFFLDPCQDHANYWRSPAVGFVIAENLNVNGGSLGCDVYYPHDSNAMDKRNGAEGKGCHYNLGSRDQDFGCVTTDGTSWTCLTQTDSADGAEDSDCSCSGDVAPENFGPHLANSLDAQSLGTGGSPTCASGGKQPHIWLDAAACWYSDAFSMVNAANSLWLARDQWNSGSLPCSTVDGDGGCFNDWQKNDRYYWGWNECPASPEVDDPANWDSIFVHLPPGIDSLCQLDDEAITYVQELLDQYPDGSHGKPISVLKESGADFDGNHGYKKTFFAQEFTLPDGSCLAKAGDNNVYRFNADDQECIDLMDNWNSQCSSR